MEVLYRSTIAAKTGPTPTPSPPVSRGGIPFMGTITSLNHGL